MVYPFGAWLLEALDRQQMSQADLTQRLVELGLEISASGVSLWCAGKTLPDPRRWPVLCRALNVELAELSKIATAPKAMGGFADQPAADAVAS